MNRDQLIKNFTTSFKKGSTYSSQEIKHFLNNIGSNYNSQNPTLTPLSEVGERIKFMQNKNKLC